MINYSWDYLVDRFILGTITDEELEVLNKEINNSPLRKRQFEEQTDFKTMARTIYAFENLDPEKAWENFEKKLHRNE